MLTGLSGACLYITTIIGHESGGLVEAPPHRIVHQLDVTDHGPLGPDPHAPELAEQPGRNTAAYRRERDKLTRDVRDWRAQRGLEEHRAAPERELEPPPTWASSSKAKLLAGVSLPARRQPAQVGLGVRGASGGDTLAGMRTLVSDPPPAEFEQLLKRRRRLGLDRRDEVWNGVLHMNPAPRGRHGDIMGQLAELLGPPARQAGLFPLVADFNLGDPDDYRVPDGGLHHERRDLTYYPSAAVAVEILSPDDETPEKIPFYAEHHVDELLIVDPAKRTVDWLALEHGEYRAVERSRLIDLRAAQLAKQIDWP